jgi:AcrR family transcriptional regulator
MDVTPEISAEQGRGDRTRQNLIEAALELFGEHGFSATSTRMIVRKAGANISSITYYFGNKEGLYRAVVGHIAENIGRFINPVYEEVFREYSKGGMDRDAVEGCIKKAVKGLMDLMIRSEEPKRWALIVLREQAKPTEAFNLLYESVMVKAHGLLSRLVASAAGIDPEGAEACIRAHSIMGSVLGFLSARETVLRRLGTSEYTEEHFDILYRLLPSMAVSGLDAKLCEEGC